jgi:hypothetical protein
MSRSFPTACLVLFSIAFYGTMPAADAFRIKPLTIAATNRIGFSLLEPRETRVDFINVLAQSRYTTNQIYLNGSGVAAGDVDGDGWCDLYFCSLAGSNVLYRNLGSFQFTNITESAGVACPGIASTGAAFADLDGDGDLDLIVNTIGNGTQVFLNDAKGHFTRTAVLNEGKGGMSLAVADYDGDGALDIYICNYRTTTLRDMPSTNFRISMIDGIPVVAAVNGEPSTLPQYEGRFALNSSGNVSEYGEADALYHNDGHGGFTRVSFTDGTFLDEDGKPLQRPPYDWSLSAMFHDLNGDGRPDLYVCSDFDTPDRIWINQGGGKFKAIAKIALRNTSRFSMGIDVADINRDGNDDIFVADMLSRDHVTRLTRADKSTDSITAGLIEGRPQFSRNTLQLNRGDNTYAEIAFFADVEASEWSWTPAFLDVDLDGFEDLLVTTGHGRDDMDLDTGLQIERTRRGTKMTPMAELAMRKNTPPLPGPKLAFRNSGHLRFEDVSEAWGFNQIGISHGMCMADLDNDGDLDLVVNNLNAPAGIYRNETSAPRVSVRLKGEKSNTHGIGAKIKTLGGPVPFQTQEMICGGRYLSSDEPLRVFAATATANSMRVEVTWATGKQTIADHVPANSVLEIFETAASATSNVVQSRNAMTALFEDASAALRHEHHEDAFDDFARQNLLPKKLCQLGPGVGWVDLDHDNREDLVIGSGKGGALAIFHNDGAGKFTPWKHFGEKPQRDSSGIVGAGSQIFVALANYEDGTTNAACIEEYQIANESKRVVFPAQPSSIGPVALADVNGDGKLELFAGGRVVPGRYPEPASSFLLRQENSEWLLDPQNAAFKNIGLVSAVLWTDLNGDGFPELVLACEWGPVKVFLNEKGTLRDATRQFGMDKMIGWWNGVSAGDFDGDGRMDLVASNWGLNTKYRVTAAARPRIYFSNWGTANEIEPVETEYDIKSGFWMPARDLGAISRALPFVRETFRTYRSFAKATIEQVLGNRLSQTQVLEANWMETTVFLNRGDHFDPIPLPPEAQLSPAFGVTVADFDGDGREDIFLSQNFFDVESQTSRCDAGRGLLLLGKGDGHFDAIDGARCGIKIYGEQRGSAAADYDADGRVDLVVTQNSAATTLWHNAGAKPGLRVRLEGPTGNPTAIGAILRLRFGEKWSPAREVHAGSGYWSQDAATQVLAMPEQPSQIQVAWPGGKITTSVVPSGARSIVVNFENGNARAE